MPDETDPTAQLMAQLGKEILHDVQPEGLQIFSRILRSIADHIDAAAKSHPEAQK